jgi:hypothetical protein
MKILRKQINRHSKHDLCFVVHAITGNPTHFLELENAASVVARLENYTFQHQNAHIQNRDGSVLHINTHFIEK